ILPSTKAWPCTTPSTCSDRAWTEPLHRADEPICIECAAASLPSNEPSTFTSLARISALHLAPCAMCRPPAALMFPSNRPEIRAVAGPALFLDRDFLLERLGMVQPQSSRRPAGAGDAADPGGARRPNPPPAGGHRPHRPDLWSGSATAPETPPV